MLAKTEALGRWLFDEAAGARHPWRGGEALCRGRKFRFLPGVPVATIPGTLELVERTPLAPRGRLALLGAGNDPLAVPPGALVAGERSVLGSITGSPFENEKTLNFSVLSGVRPCIETMPLEEAPDAVRRMRSGEVKFRMVLTMRETQDAH